MYKVKHALTPKPVCIKSIQATIYGPKTSCFCFVGIPYNSNILDQNSGISCRIRKEGPGKSIGYCSRVHLGDCAGGEVLSSTNT